jgi:lipopolysaccharide biosynthesis glycosyltransferase
MNIVYALTANFINKAIPSMRSVLEHNPKAKIYLLTEVDAVDIGIPVTVVNISGQEYFQPRTCVNLPNNFGGAINLLKVAYPDLLPKLQKVIHLDADTIITGPLDELWKTDLTGKWLAAVREDRGRYHPFGDAYYNMGVALLNLAQLRKDKAVEQMVHYLNTVRQPFADQDAWNKYAIEQDKAVALPVKWNENFATGYTDSPAIVHYCGFADWWTNTRMPRREYLEHYMAEPRA